MIIKRYKKVYICHPYAGSGSIDENVEKVLGIVESITDETKKLLEEAKVRDEDQDEKKDCCDPQVEVPIPIAVHLLFPRFMSEETFGREVAMEFCLQVLKNCDEIWVYGPILTAGMRQEVTLAGNNHITIVWKNFD